MEQTVARVRAAADRAAAALTGADADAGPPGPGPVARPGPSETGALRNGGLAVADMGGPNLGGKQEEERHEAPLCLVRKGEGCFLA